MKIDYEFQRAARMSEHWDEIKGRLCVDCKYFREGVEGTPWHTCSLFEVHSPVTGEVHYRHCSIAREERGGCGERGYFWEAKDAPA